MTIMVRHDNEVVSYAPLYIHSFQLLQPHATVEAEKFNIRYTDPSQIEHTAEKLRYYRYKKALLQRDVADYAGIDRSTYSSYEEAGRDYYPLDKLKRIAELLEVEVTELMDHYNRFLYDGQGGQVQAIRKSMGLTQTEFGKRMAVTKSAVKDWENNKTRMQKRVWQILF